MNESGESGGVEQAGGGEAASEEELRARLEQELKKIAVEDVVLQTVITLVNLGGQRLGLSEETKDVRDPGQTRMAIEAIRSLLPLLEARDGAAEQLRPVRDALAQLQIAYAREVAPEQEAGGGERRPDQGQAAADEEKSATPPRKSEGSGGLWVPPGSAE